MIKILKKIFKNQNEKMIKKALAKHLTSICTKNEKSNFVIFNLQQNVCSDLA